MERQPALPLGQIQRAWDKAPPKAGVYEVEYKADQVVKIRVRQYMPTTIVFPSWETFSAAPLLGDTFAFEAAFEAGNKLVIRAKQVGADTAVTVFGDSGNVYAFYVRAEGPNSKNIPDVLVYVHAPMPLSVLGKMMGAKGGPGAGGVKLASASSGAIGPGTGKKNPDFLHDVPFDPSKLRFDFTMSGDKTIAPERVFSDGVFTWFDFGDKWLSSDLPAVYRVVDGVDTPVNTRVKGTMLVAEATGAFTLRNGQRTVCVRPAGYVPEGTYKASPAPSGTSASAAAPDLAAGRDPG